MLKLRKNKKGFTLVELIVVIAIMAVLAGTVAGVTVSQLNKQTDNANKTQAKKVADHIASLIIEGDIYTPTSGDNSGKFVLKGETDALLTAANLKTTVDTEFPNVIAASAGKGNISLTVADAGNSITVTYTHKAGNKTTTYTINGEGIVSET
ncbi:MAG: type II secretion system GspH family protein [Clostridiales bacterium]|nr:MAG: type II secretion system GspH family protein [Clostridiales bacterium]